MSTSEGKYVLVEVGALIKQPDSFARQSFLISSELHTAGKNSFYSNLMKISEYFNFGTFSPDLVDTAKVTMFLQLMKQKYISYWQHTLHPRRPRGS